MQRQTPLSPLKRLLTQYIRPHKAKIGLAVICMILVAAVTAANAKLMEPVFDEVFIARNRDMLVMIPLIVIGLAIIKALASYGQFMLMRTVGQRIMSDMQLQLYRHLIHSDLSLFTQEGSGVMISRFTNDIAMMRESLSNVITGIAKEFFSLIFLIAVMISQSWQLSIIALIIFPLAVYPLSRMGKRMRKLSRDTQQELGQFTSQLDETFQSIRIIKAYGQEEREINRAHQLIETVYRLYIKGFRLKSASSPLMEMLAGIAVAAVIWYGGLQVMEGTTTPGSFMSFMTAVIMAYKPAKSMAGLNTSLQEGLGAASRLFDVFDRHPIICDAPQAAPLQITEGRILIDNLSFHYDATASHLAPALDSVSMSIEPGRTIALVGASGGGKSTILNMLLRFYDPTQGRILIDGQDIRSVTLNSLRRKFALVSQDTLLFDDTVENNIRYGNPSTSFEAVRNAAENAAAHDFIISLPDGYNTRIGPHGATLSGGQAQRIAIARALLSEAPFLLLDEATSALDADSESQVQDAMSRLHHQKTIIIIAHRLSTIKEADIIHVLEQGRIVESGTHQALLNKKGSYARLYARQSESHGQPQR